MILNITYEGTSQDFEIGEVELSDDEVRRIAPELLANWSAVLGRPIPGDAFNNFAVDRFNTPEGGRRLFLRPKGPISTRREELWAEWESHGFQLL